MGIAGSTHPTDLKPTLRLSQATRWTSLRHFHPTRLPRSNAEKGQTMSRSTSPVIPGFGLTLGYTLVYLSLLVLIPLGAMFVHAAQLTWAEFWAIISAPRVLAALKLSFATAFAA